MLVKDILCEVFELVGRHDVYDVVKGNKSLNDEQSRVQRACLTYLNAVVDELARGYFPIEYGEEMTSSDGRFAFSDFTYKPLEIKKVSVNSKPVVWRVVPDYLIADAATIYVRYTYAPDAFGLGEEFAYPHYAVGKRLVEYGILAEYYLVLGDADSAAAWENKYREEIENLLSKSTVRGRIPPRRWI